MKKAYKYTINGKKYEVTIGDVTENVATVCVNGEEYQVEMEAEPEAEKPVVKPVAAKPAAAPAAAPSRNANADSALKAPLPGVVTEIRVNVGDEVQPGDVVLVLEAMKMANNIEAEKAGKVTAVCVQPGQSVMEDDVLVVIE